LIAFLLTSGCVRSFLPGSSECRPLLSRFEVDALKEGASVFRMEEVWRNLSLGFCYAHTRLRPV